MQVDKVAMMQGIIDAHADNKIPKELYESLMGNIQMAAKPGSVNRDECDYVDLLGIFAQIDNVFYVYVANLWEYLGRSLASGIAVAN